MNKTKPSFLFILHPSSFRKRGWRCRGRVRAFLGDLVRFLGLVGLPLGPPPCRFLNAALLPRAGHGRRMPPSASFPLFAHRATFTFLAGIATGTKASPLTGSSLGFSMV